MFDEQPDPTEAEIAEERARQARNDLIYKAIESVPCADFLGWFAGCTLGQDSCRCYAIGAAVAALLQPSASPPSSPVERRTGERRIRRGKFDDRAAEPVRNGKMPDRRASATGSEKE